MGFFDLLWGWADYEPKNWSGESLSVEEEPTCFVVRDQHSGQKLATVYFEDQLDRRLAAKLPTKAEARHRSQHCEPAGASEQDRRAQDGQIVVVLAACPPPPWTVEEQDACYVVKWCYRLPT